MELTGGEYWTYFLPRRVGTNAAMELTGATRPITANQAHAMGMVDDILKHSTSSTFYEEVRTQRSDNFKNASGLLECTISRKRLASREKPCFCYLIKEERQYDISATGTNRTSREPDLRRMSRVRRVAPHKKFCDKDRVEPVKPTGKVNFDRVQ